MAKNINMTRERKIALPHILEAAQRYLDSLNHNDPRRARIGDALEKFK